MEKQKQDSAENQLARPRVNLEYLSENTNLYGTFLPVLGKISLKILPWAREAAHKMACRCSGMDLKLGEFNTHNNLKKA